MRAPRASRTYLAIVVHDARGRQWHGTKIQTLRCQSDRETTIDFSSDPRTVTSEHG